MTDIAPCPRCHYGAGPQGAERYWEARWRDEKAHNDALVEAAQNLIDEISTRGTHERWKRLANLIHDLVSPPMEPS